MTSNCILNQASPYFAISYLAWTKLSALFFCFLIDFDARAPIQFSSCAWVSSCCSCVFVTSDIIINYYPFVKLFARRVFCIVIMVWWKLHLSVISNLQLINFSHLLKKNFFFLHLYEKRSSCGCWRHPRGIMQIGPIYYAFVFAFFFCRSW